MAALGTSLGGIVASPAARRQRRRSRTKSQIRASDIHQAAPRRLARGRFPLEVTVANAPAFPAKSARSPILLSVAVPVWTANERRDPSALARVAAPESRRAPLKLNLAAARLTQDIAPISMHCAPWARCCGPSISHNHGLSATIRRRGEKMKLPLFALSFITAAVVSVSTAQAQNYPWCSMVDLGDEILNCGFDSLEQCKASLSGGGDTCIQNNTYKPPPPESVSAEGASAPAQVPLPPAKKAQRHSTAPPAQGSAAGTGLSR